LSIESGKQDSVAVQLNHQAKQQILDNRRKITPIIETVIFCGRQGIRLRGHRDSGPLSFVEAESGDINDGNFRALIRYRAGVSNSTCSVGHIRTYKVTRGPHYNADATTAVCGLARNSFWIFISCGRDHEL